MTYKAALKIAQDMETNWERWHDLDRAEAVLALLDYGLSRRALARIARCSEGSIRNMEIVGRLPDPWKQYLREGHATRNVVAAWRAQRRQQAV
jgi:hypothetical protein